MNKINAIVIEDEPNNLELLINLLEEYCPTVEVMATAGTVKNAVVKLRANNPDLVFLDIELPDGNGFEVLEKIPTRNFTTVFTTGYDQYAVKAIKYAAYDYLLKPLSIDDLQAVIEKYKEDKLQDSIPNDKIFVTDHEKYRIIDCMNVHYLEAQDNYTFIHLQKDKILSSYTIGKYEESLPDYIFRSHRSFLVNVHHIKNISRGSGGEIHMKNGAVVPVAYRRKSSLLDAIKKYAE